MKNNKKEKKEIDWGEITFEVQPTKTITIGADYTLERPQEN